MKKREAFHLSLSRLVCCLVLCALFCGWISVAEASRPQRSSGFEYIFVGRINSVKAYSDFLASRGDLYLWMLMKFDAREGFQTVLQASHPILFCQATIDFFDAAYIRWKIDKVQGEYLFFPLGFDSDLDLFFRDFLEVFSPYGDLYHWPVQHLPPVRFKTSLFTPAGH